MWPSLRIHQMQPQLSPLCVRCTQNRRDSLFHMCWECPGNLEIDHPAIHDTNNLAHTAAVGCHDYPCLWLRGILPSNLVALPPGNEPPASPQYSITNPLGTPASNMWTSGIYYGDGSGGSLAEYSSIRRCAFSVVFMGPQNQM